MLFTTKLLMLRGSGTSPPPKLVQDPPTNANISLKVESYTIVPDVAVNASLALVDKLARDNAPQNKLAGFGEDKFEIDINDALNHRLRYY
jgi:hypothetical protein